MMWMAKGVRPVRLQSSSDHVYQSSTEKRALASRCSIAPGAIVGLLLPFLLLVLGFGGRTEPVPVNSLIGVFGRNALYFNFFSHCAFRYIALQQHAFIITFFSGMGITGQGALLGLGMLVVAVLYFKISTKPRRSINKDIDPPARSTDSMDRAFRNFYCGFCSNSHLSQCQQAEVSKADNGLCISLRLEF